MSRRAQNAFSKNHTLQKQLEDKYLVLRRSFKHCRRRHDTVEEECLSSLYKLLLYAKEKQDDEDKEESGDKENVAKRPNSVFDKSKTTNKVTGKQRPATALSAKTYTQSYSFAKNGMDIQKAIRERYMRSKQEKEKSKEPFFKIERLDTRRESVQNSENRPMTTVPTVDHTEFPEPSPRRPKTAHPDISGNGTSLSRPQVKITLPGNDASMTSSTTTIHKMNAVPLEAILSYNTETGNLRQIVKSISGHGRFLPPKQPNESTTRQNTKQTSGRLSVSQGSDTVDGETASDRSTVRADSRLCNKGDDLIPLTSAEQNELDMLCVQKSEDLSRNRLCPSRAWSRSVSPRAASTPTARNLLKKSSDQTQMFLTQYSKKSKLFGYVVKSRASPVTPRDRVMSFRSPSITYQELAAIKAGIKQQVSSTRSLVQRSAKLSIYVDTLANGSLLRQHRKELKETRASTN